MRELYLNLHREPFNSEANIFDYLPSIENLELCGSFSNVNWDSLINLKSLKLHGEIMVDFNVDSFANLCNRLEKLAVNFSNLDIIIITRIFKRLLFKCNIKYSLLSAIVSNYFNNKRYKFHRFYIYRSTV